MTVRELRALRSFRWWRHKGLSPLAARAEVLRIFQDSYFANFAYLLGA